MYKLLYILYVYIQANRQESINKSFKREIYVQLDENEETLDSLENDDDDLSVNSTESFGSNAMLKSSNTDLEKMKKLHKQISINNNMNGNIGLNKRQLVRQTGTNMATIGINASYLLAFD